MQLRVEAGRIGILIEDNGVEDREIIAARAAQHLRDTIESQGWVKEHFEVCFPDREIITLDALSTGWIVEEQTMLAYQDFGDTR